MKIEVLYFDGCPSHERLMPRLRELLDRAGVDTAVDLVHIGSLEAAERQRFLGSPTVRVDGVDVDPGALARTDFGLKCRLYPSPDGGQRGVPPDEWITVAVTRRPTMPDTTSATAAACGSGFGFCQPGEAPSEPLTGRQRAGRAIVGGALIAAATRAPVSPKAARAPIVCGLGWLGVSHVVAAAPRYNGCPELGAIPSLVLRRHVHTRCGPWRSLDQWLGLVKTPGGPAHV